MNVFWSDIESRFFKLHSEQRFANGLVYAMNCDGSWTLGGPKDLQKKFRSILGNIAVRLGWATDKDPLSVWCELLKRHGVGYHKMTGSTVRRRAELDTERMCSIEREQRDTQGGTIDLLCKVSAEYCIECDTKEVASARAKAAGRQIFAAQNIGKTAQIVERKSTPPNDQTALLPQTWEELRKRISVTQKEAAQFLKCDPRTIRRRVKAKELTRSPKGRIVCNEHLRNQIRIVHGAHVLR